MLGTKGNFYKFPERVIIGFEILPAILLWEKVDKGVMLSKILKENNGQNGRILYPGKLPIKYKGTFRHVRA